MEKRKIDKEKIKIATRMLIEAIGDDPDREGLVETPRRVAGYWEELAEGMLYTNEEIGNMFKKEFELPTDDLVTMPDINVFSHCEHHLALMFDMKVHVAYLPKDGKVLGISKIARIADMCAKRLQLQEKIGMDIAECIQIATGTEDVLVVIEGRHACVSARGIKKDSKLRTATARGAFKVDKGLEERAYVLLGLN